MTNTVRLLVEYYYAVGKLTLSFFFVNIKDSNSYQIPTNSLILICAIAFHYDMMWVVLFYSGAITILLDMRIIFS